jgi:hypothetical protein
MQLMLQGIHEITCIKTSGDEQGEGLLSGGKNKKLKLSLCLTKHHAMKTYWWSGGIAPRILDLGTRWK